MIRELAGGERLIGDYWIMTSRPRYEQLKDPVLRRAYQPLAAVIAQRWASEDARPFSFIAVAALGGPGERYTATAADHAEMLVRYADWMVLP